jgi:replicative DNA helicase
MTPLDYEMEAERSVIGALLLSGKVELATREGLKPEHFIPHTGRGLIYAAMIEVDKRGDHVDRLTVVHRLQRAGRLEEAGGQVTVEMYAACPPVAGNVQSYARIVMDAAGWRARHRRLLEGFTAYELRDEAAWSKAMGVDNVIPLRRAS